MITERKGPLGVIYWDVTINNVINNIKTKVINTNKPEYE